MQNQRALAALAYPAKTDMNAVVMFLLETLPLGWSVRGVAEDETGTPSSVFMAARYPEAADELAYRQMCTFHIVPPWEPLYS